MITVRRVRGSGIWPKPHKDRLPAWWLGVALLSLLAACLSALPSSAAASGDARTEGYAYVIIAPDIPVFLSYASSLRDLRVPEGISTGVFDTGEIGSTWQEIRTFLADAYQSWTTPPEAVLLLGDHPLIPAPIYSGVMASDNLYADIDGDGLPEFAMARMTARNAAELESMVGKVLAHELVPCLDPAFYAHPLFAGGWDPDGSSIMETETYAGFLASNLGREPMREYIADTPGTEWPDPDWLAQFGPDGLGYLPPDPTYLTDWDGSAAGINAVINAGSCLVLHRGRGQQTGWGDPGYTTVDVAGLSNTAYPIVLSLECLSGNFTYGTDCLTEALHRSPHGALGIVSATEVSYSSITRLLALYLLDSLWPGFIPGGAEGEPERRPAFALAKAKRLLEADQSPYNPSQKSYTYHLFHYHGEPYTAMHDQVPTPLAVEYEPYCLIGSTSFTICADAGARIGLSVEGEIIGAGFGTGEPESIPIVPPADSGELRIVVTQANHLRHDNSVPILDLSAVSQNEARITGLDLRFPNPAAAGRMLEIDCLLPARLAREPVTLRVHDASGRTVRALLRGQRLPASGQIYWDGRNDGGAEVSGGVFFVRLTCGHEETARRLVLLD